MWSALTLTQVRQSILMHIPTNKTYTHMYACTHTHTHTHTYMHTHMHICAHTCTHTHTHTHTLSLSLSLFLSHIHRGPRWLYLVEGGWRSANSVVDFEVSQAVRPHATHQQLHNKDNHKFGAQIIPTAETPNKDNHNKFLAQIIHFVESTTIEAIPA